MKKRLQLLSLSFLASSYASVGKSPRHPDLTKKIQQVENADNPMNPGAGKSNQPSTHPAPDLEPKISSYGIGKGREPGPSTMDIRYHRDQISGKFIIDEVNPHGPFKHLEGIKETEEEPKPHF